MRRAPFISSQRLALLECPRGDQPTDYLSGVGFRPFDETGHQAVGDSEEPGAADVWRPVTDRVALLGGVDCSRLVLTEVGGIGKTTALAQVEYLRSVRNAGRLCIRLEAAQLPLRVADYLGPDPSDKSSDAGLRRLIEEFRAFPETEGIQVADTWKLIHQKIRRGEFSLLVDALDQVGLEDDESARDRIEKLGLFLQQHPEIHCVVTGRPYSVTNYWKELGPAGDWKVAAVGPFTEAEQKAYLTEPRWQLLKNLEADVLSVPRALKRLRSIDDDDLLGKLRTASDVYWESLRPMLEEGCQKSHGIRIEQAIALFALLAFEMLKRGHYVEIASGDGWDRFLDEVEAERGEWLARRPIRLRRDETLDDRLEVLGRLNIGMRNAIAENTGLTCIRWHDRTLQDFFAAVWCTRYAEPEDLNWLSQHTYLHFRRREARSPEEEAQQQRESREPYHEFWKLLGGMPRHTLRSRGSSQPVADTAVFDDRRWVEAVAACYKQEGGRSTELIYRTWPRLLEIAAYTEEELGVTLPTMPSEAEVDAYNARLQGWVKGRVDSGESFGSPGTPDTAKGSARRIVEEYLSEFPRLLLGEGRGESQRIAREFHVDWFKTKQVEPGRFAMGGDGFYDGPIHEGRIEVPFRMARYPVTNELMDRFDPSRTERFDNYAKYSGEERCPAIYCTWYDAWALGLWLHASLPTEQEWECVCRGEEHRDEHLRFGWFNDKAELGANAWCDESKGHAYVPIRVDGSWEGAVDEKERSPYGVTHLLGQVFEWTASTYGKDPREPPPAHAGSSRVLRGGSFYDDPDYCRAAAPFDYPPRNSVYDVGIRLVRRS
ncbi:Formylglycine-generating sulfatase enzyme [Planctomycetes bacterium MalM25]|nr:Formylglycine-generating sulfatase enzyme [Planctomycetes bacterium MalM25]